MVIFQFAMLNYQRVFSSKAHRLWKKKHHDFRGSQLPIAMNAALASQQNEAHQTAQGCRQVREGSIPGEDGTANRPGLVFW
jgi:hypothetical protein